MINSSLSDELQELAAGYVLDDLEPEEVSRVEQLIEENPAFLAEIRELQGVMGAIASSVPQRQPPAGLLDQVMAAVDSPQEKTEANLSQLFVNLGHWLDEIFEPLWESPETLNLAFTARRTADLQEAAIQRGKVIELGAQSVVLLMGVTAQENSQVRVSIQLHPQPQQRYLPANLQLTLLSESEQILRSVQTGHADNYIKLPRFTVTAGVQFSLQLHLDQFSGTEKFVV